MTVLGIHASKRAPQSGSQEREKLLEHARLVLAVTGHVLLQALEHGLGMSNTFQKLHRHPDASVRSHLLPLHLPLRNVPTLRQRKIILKIIEVKKQPVLEARLRGRKMYAGMLLHKLERLVKAFMAVAIKDQPALGRGGGPLLRQDTNPEVLVTSGFFFISIVNQALSALNYSHTFLKNRQIAPHFAT